MARPKKNKRIKLSDDKIRFMREHTDLFKTIDEGYFQRKIKAFERMLSEDQQNYNLGYLNALAGINLDINLILDYCETTDLQCTLTEIQFKIILPVYNTYINAKDIDLTLQELKDLFACKQNKFRIKNNRLLAYFMCKLSNQKFITNAYQKEIEKQKLFVSFKGKVLTAIDIDRGLHQKYLDKPKHSEVIDSLIYAIKNIE